MATLTANTESPGAANKTFTQVLQKHAGRAKERILQNLGRADRTKDEVFEVYMNNFSRQQLAATKLQKEFKNYLLCIKSMQMASKNLMDTLSEICEQEWVGHEQIPIKAQALDLLWEDYFRKMNDILNPINSYIAQFHETRNKIGKRGRKLVDYDKSRHNVEALRNSAKKKDDVKLTRAREELEQAKQLYEQLNNELHDELPRLYDSRIPFLVRNLQTLFDAECRFHNENAIIHQFLNETMHRLARDSGHPIVAVQPPPTVPPMLRLSTPTAGAANATSIAGGGGGGGGSVGGDSRPTSLRAAGNAAGTPQHSTHSSSSVAASTPAGASPSSAAAGAAATAAASSPGGEIRPYEEIDFKKDGPTSREASTGGSSTAASPTKSPMASSPMNGGQRSVHSTDHGDYDIPVGATTTDLPPGTLYRVRATYKYIAEDSDELTFESGETIRVVEYDDPEEQEEGWLMGIKESTGQKGLFPANFTRPI